MIEVPSGCAKTAQISFIKDEQMRPHPDFKWLIECIKENGDTVITCRSTLENAFEFTKAEIG